MSANVSFLLGYGGYCRMNLRTEMPSVIQNQNNAAWVTVPLLSGSYDRSMQVPMQSTFSTPLDGSKRTKIRTGMGVYNYSGNMSFEMSTELVPMLINENMFKRLSFLDIEMSDGEGLLRIPGAVWSSFGIQADAGGIIQGNISFLSCNGYKHDIKVFDPNPSITLDDPNSEPYWKYGGKCIQSFQLNFSRSIMPVYLNEKNWIGPSYIRVGLLDVSLSVTCWEQWFDHASIRLGEKTITFNSASFMSSRGYQVAGINGEGMKTYTNTALGIEGDGDLFVISSQGSTP